MLEHELSEMDRVTQLQDAIEEVRFHFYSMRYVDGQGTLTTDLHTSCSVLCLTASSTSLLPRAPYKLILTFPSPKLIRFLHLLKNLKACTAFTVERRESRSLAIIAKKKALVDELMEKANLISFLIDALPVAEKEEDQVCEIIDRPSRIERPILHR